MVLQHIPDGGPDLTHQVSLDNYGDSNYVSHDDDDSGAFLLSSPSQRPRQRSTFLTNLLNLITWRKIKQHTFRRAKRITRGPGCGTVWLRRILLLAYTFLGFVVALTVFVGIFSPSYTKLPSHYQLLKDRVLDGWMSGSGNVNQEKVFIAASIYDPGGKLASGDWAQNVLDLIHILGPEHVYLSIYENDSGQEALEALASLETKVPCNHTLISEPHLDPEDIPHVILPDGSRRMRRIAYLAEVRNRALKPLEHAHIRFDKLLYLNDVMFNPVEAAQLLFNTNVGSDGRAQYRSACAVDFINSFKFYDTFATRDLEGFSMGVPFFPWFPATGGDNTLDQVLGGSDAVRVRSCWGGMVAFDARFFQNWSGEGAAIRTAGNESPSNLSAPYRFRAEPDMWWESSECCLIHADIQSPDPTNPGIFMNPYIRVAYDTRTLSWLWFSKRFEKLYSPIHFIADLVASLPHFNPRRDEIPWRSVEEVIWVDDDSKSGSGSWRKVNRIAKHDGFCGKRDLQVIKEKKNKGEKNWEIITPPPMIS